MAEHGAHLTSSTFDAKRPTVFEVLAQQSLMSTLRPAIKHAVRVFAEKYPAQLGPLLRFYDEIYLVLDSIIQMNFLRKHSSSFAENFYDLKRVPCSNPEASSLSSGQQLRSLACLVLIPYVRQKLDMLFEDLRYKYSNASSSWRQRNISKKQRLVHVFLALYPYVHSSWELAILGYQLSFMLRDGKWHSPDLHLSAAQLQRADPQSQNESSDNIVPQWMTMSFSSKLRYLLKWALGIMATCLSTSLSLGVFFLQFLDWWYASDSSAPSLTALPIPEAPKIPKCEDVDSHTCPLCMQPRINSAALSVSGYVFCYRCINRHVKQQNCCPVSGYPATAEHIVRIYEQQL